MRKVVRHIVFAMTLALCLTSCQKPKGVIGRDDMAKIMADMLLADRWVSTESAEIRRQSDTTSFYEPILNKYGFTLENYITSVDYYLNDPDRFSDIMEKTEDILRNHRDELQHELHPDEENQSDAVVDMDEVDDPQALPEELSKRELKKLKRANQKPDQL